MFIHESNLSFLDAYPPIKKSKSLGEMQGELKSQGGLKLQLGWQGEKQLWQQSLGKHPQLKFGFWFGQENLGQGETDVNGRKLA